MEHRNRASGWKYAKLSGHTNEDRVKQLLDSDAEYAGQFLCRIGRPNAVMHATSVGGLHETMVPGVSGRKTKSKTDLKIFLEGQSSVTVSIKKSLVGQVYFVRASRFIQTFEAQFHRPVPCDVQRAISLFWAAADDADLIIRQYADRSNGNDYDRQLRHHSLNASTLLAYDPNLHQAMLNWFSENAYDITRLCFSMGAASSPAEWSDYIWYINLLGEHNTDAVFPIHDLCCAVQACAAEETCYSSKNGGTTIQLPFGFVEWHQSQMQFHHSYEKISRLLGL